MASRACYIQDDLFVFCCCCNVAKKLIEHLLKKEWQTNSEPRERVMPGLKQKARKKKVNLKEDKKKREPKKAKNVQPRINTRRIKTTAHIHSAVTRNPIERRCPKRYKRYADVWNATYRSKLTSIWVVCTSRSGFLPNLKLFPLSGLFMVVNNWKRKPLPSSLCRRQYGRDVSRWDVVYCYLWGEKRFSYLGFNNLPVTLHFAPCISVFAGFPCGGNPQTWRGSLRIRNANFFNVNKYRFSRVHVCNEDIQASTLYSRGATLHA